MSHHCNVKGTVGCFWHDVFFYKLLAGHPLPSPHSSQHVDTSILHYFPLVPKGSNQQTGSLVVTFLNLRSYFKRHIAIQDASFFLFLLQLDCTLCTLRCITFINKHFEWTFWNLYFTLLVKMKISQLFYWIICCLRKGIRSSWIFYICLQRNFVFNISMF